MDYLVTSGLLHNLYMNKIMVCCVGVSTAVILHKPMKGLHSYKLKKQTGVYIQMVPKYKKLTSNIRQRKGTLVYSHA